MIKEYKELIKQKLEEAMMQKLDYGKHIPVEIPTTINNYILRHNTGSYLIAYKGSTFSNKNL